MPHVTGGQESYFATSRGGLQSKRRAIVEKDLFALTTFDVPPTPRVTGQMTQWHPIFSHLLRSVLQDYYDIETNVPVGDLPREADGIVLRRATAHKPPFRGLWRHLSRWNILEIKGRSESARVGDVELLVEVGLGIGRRLHEKSPTPKTPPVQVSFWYLANRLGKRFLRDVVELTGKLKSVEAGVWRGTVLGRPLWLVSNRDVPINAESAPVRIVSEQSVEQTRELADIVTGSEALWQTYGPWLCLLYPSLWKELDAMAVKRKRGEIDWRVDRELRAKILRATGAPRGGRGCHRSVWPRRFDREPEPRAAP